MTFCIIAITEETIDEALNLCPDRAGDATIVPTAETQGAVY